MYKTIKLCSIFIIMIIFLINMLTFATCSIIVTSAEKEKVVVPEPITTVLPAAACEVLESFATCSIIVTSAELEPITVEEPAVNEKQFSDEEVDIIAQTLAGECYDDKLEDKRNVAKVIVNRVSNGFGKNVIEVVTAPRQFCGYWKQSRPVSESDIQIAYEVLNDWYANDCKALSEYLFFCAGPNRENVFRSRY